MAGPRIMTARKRWTQSHLFPASAPRPYGRGLVSSLKGKLRHDIVKFRKRKNAVTCFSGPETGGPRPPAL
jgi:hypothetical protein